MVQVIGEVYSYSPRSRDSDCEKGGALSGDTITLKGCKIKPIGTSEEGTIVIALIKLPWETSAVVRTITVGYENRFTETHNSDYRSIGYRGVYDHIIKFEVCTQPGAAKEVPVGSTVTVKIKGRNEGDAVGSVILAVARGDTNEVLIHEREYSVPIGGLTDEYTATFAMPDNDVLLYFDAGHIVGADT